jgi:hypothetical protein
MQAGLDDPEITDQSIKGAAQLILASLSPREVGSLDRELEGKSEYRSFTRLPSNQQSVDDELGRSRFSKDVNDSLSVSTLSSSVIYAAERTFGRQYQNNPFGVSSPFGGQAQLSHDQTTAQLVRSARNRAAASQQMVKVRTLDGKHGVLPGSGKGNMGLLSQESTLGPDVEAELLFSIEIDPGNFEFAAVQQEATSINLVRMLRFCLHIARTVFVDWKAARTSLRAYRGDPALCCPSDSQSPVFLTTLLYTLILPCVSGRTIVRLKRVRCKACLALLQHTCEALSNMRTAAAHHRCWRLDTPHSVKRNYQS